MLVNILFYLQLSSLLISHTNIDVILILEHSFYLSQHDPQPISSAVQKYNAANTPARVGNALEEVFKHYNKASETEKVDMVLKVIIQNHMGELNILFNILFITNSISDTSAAK